MLPPVPSRITPASFSSLSTLHSGLKPHLRNSFSKTVCPPLTGTGINYTKLRDKQTAYTKQNIYPTVPGVTDLLATIVVLTDKSVLAKVGIKNELLI